MTKSIVVFCGSKQGNSWIYHEVAYELGMILAQRGIRLIYGGGSAGVMGTLAKAAKLAGGEVIAITPRQLHKDYKHFTPTEIRIKDHIHERKAEMYQLADGAIVLPGGLGTFEETLEFATWSQLDFHCHPFPKKPCCILNVRNFFEGLIYLFDHAVEEGFLDQEHRDAVTVKQYPKDAVDSIYEKIEEWQRVKLVLGT